MQPGVAASRLTLATLLLLGLFNLWRGGLHVFLPDSGAGSIAHFDLSQGGQTIVFLLAMTGSGQIGAGLIDLAVAARFRAFAVPLLVIEAAKQGLALYIAFVSKPPPHEVPGRAGMIVTLIVLGLALGWEFGRRLRRDPA
ncbi:hypothetical protein [Caulobacter sp. NIBR1757]|uniref:hypothetical protein n=1 Tax=Caulobacter sp. NIBR1757 TaxID=3016000 RepID=UPI0022F0512E|nr:hypothetical protein [Caulobacter sp. NIBR1757]WGM38532.1 hypothetical protein AMEJIAPC_01435 [Caulobacter sp. NIBR1757]